MAQSATETTPRIAYSPAEFAEAVGCSRAHVHNLIRRGELPSVMLGRKRLIPVAAVIELLEGNCPSVRLGSARLIRADTLERILNGEEASAPPPGSRLESSGHRTTSTPGPVGRQTERAAQ